jgi:hypothetical protein
MLLKVSAHLRMVFALALVAGFMGLTLSLSPENASAAARPIPNCMGKDMGGMARAMGSDWGAFVAQHAQDPSLLGMNWGQAMVFHLAGGFGEPFSCLPLP